MVLWQQCSLNTGNVTFLFKAVSLPAALLTTSPEGQVPPFHTHTTLPHLPYETRASCLFTVKPEIYSYAPAQAPGKADYYFQQGGQYLDIVT